MFLYRENEIALLNEDFNKANSSLSFIFGRREIGKTSLINEYIKVKKALYLHVWETMPFLLLDKFKELIDSFFDCRNSERIDSIEDLIIYLSKKKIESKIVIILENAQELLKIEKNFFINFNKYWIKYLSKLNIQFIISSALLPNNFENLQIFKKISNVIKLESIKFNVIEDYFPNINKEEAMYIYSVFGTNPRYLSLYNPKKDFFENIKDLFLRYDSLLFNKGINLIKKDLNDLGTYCSILYAVSIGNNKIGEIASFLNLKSTYLTRYLQKLIDLLIIDKNIPINDDFTKSKFGRYKINDNLLRFWFYYIYPNINDINCDNTNNIFKFINEDFDKNFVDYNYKEYAIEVLSINSYDFFNYEPRKKGSWWNNKEIKIDFVAYDSKTITFVDCKWQKKSMIENYYKELKDKAKNFETQLEKKYIIFTGK